MVVLPLVPVTPTSFNFCEGLIIKVMRDQTGGFGTVAYLHIGNTFSFVQQAMLRKQLPQHPSQLLFQ